MTNIIKPLQAEFGTQLVQNISSDNTCKMFGESVICMGTNNVKQALKVKGVKMKYLYCDELVTFPEEVVTEFFACLDTPYSVADMTCNPSYPTHYVKKMIDENPKDIYYQQYTIWDNDFLPEKEREFIINRYRPEDSVWWRRYCDGEWAIASGILFPIFAENPSAFEKPFIDRQKGKVERFAEINIAIDIGGTKSKHSLTCAGITPNWRGVHFLRSELKDAKNTTPQDIEKWAVNFYDECRMAFGDIRHFYYDSAEQVIGRGLKLALRERNPLLSVRGAAKPPIIDRVHAMTRLFAAKNAWLTKDCKTLKESLTQLVWNPDKEDEVLDDGSTDNDSWDSAMYCITNRLRNFITINSGFIYN